MELYFLLMLVVLMAGALASGYPVAFALPGSAIVTILAAGAAGYLFAGDTTAYFSQGGPWQWLSAGVTNFRGVYWEVERDTLIAIPLFVFMGIMLQRSKIAEDLLVTMAQLFGPVPGGLGISVVFVGALLAATTGIVGATVVAMGLISLPAMMRNNYSHSLSTGIIAASGTLGQIIPPSIVLIILADQLSSAVDQASTARKALYKATTGEFSLPSSFDIVSTSAGDMFLGALIPGLILVGIYMLYILVFAFLRPKQAPAISFDGGYDKNFWIKVAVTLVPPLTLIFIVLGSIISGVATVNQAGAIGAVGATVMAGARLKDGQPRAYWPAVIALLSIVVTMLVVHYLPTNIKDVSSSAAVWGLVLAGTSTLIFLIAVFWSGWRVLRIDNTMYSVMADTAKTTSLVFIILLGAAMLTAAFRAFGGEDLVRDFLTGMPGGFWGQFITVMLVIFVLGFFLDFIEISVVVVPIVAPILLADPSANITAVWLGVMIGLNIQTSFLTPPFGFALFYLRGVAPKAVKTLSMYKGVVPFIGLQLIVLAIVAVNPPLVNYLPNRISLTSDTAPPPINPRIQACIENYVGEKFASDGDRIQQAIATAKTLDMSFVPAKLSKNYSESIEKAASAMTLYDNIGKADQVVEEKSHAYRPLHTQVRNLQRRVFRNKGEIKRLKTAAGRVDGDDAKARARKEAILARIKAVEEENAELTQKIPPEWKERHGVFSKYLKSAKKARADYRRNVDNAYEPLQTLIATIEGGGTLSGLAEPLAGLAEKARTLPPKEAGKAFSQVSKALTKIKGTSAIRNALKYAKRAVVGRKKKPEVAQKKLEKAIALLDKEVAWRAKAKTELLPRLTTYADALRDNIGLRLQTNLTKDQALYIASCSSGHKDISLNF
jgi:tripartite ATP-independent transporter DctM subunit